MSWGDARVREGGRGGGRDTGLWRDRHARRLFRGRDGWDETLSLQICPSRPVRTLLLISPPRRQPQSCRRCTGPQRAPPFGGREATWPGQVRRFPFWHLLSSCFARGPRRLQLHDRSRRGRRRRALGNGRRYFCPRFIAHVDTKVHAWLRVWLKGQKLIFRPIQGHFVHESSNRAIGNFTWLPI